MSTQHQPDALRDILADGGRRIGADIDALLATPDHRLLQALGEADAQGAAVFVAARRTAELDGDKALLACLDAIHAATDKGLLSPAVVLAGLAAGGRVMGYSESEFVERSRAALGSAAFDVELVKLREAGLWPWRAIP